jgi:hypothetical protein
MGHLSISLPITIKLDSSMPKSLIRGTKEEKKEKGRRTTSQDVGNGEDFTIYKYEGSTEEMDNKESNKAKVKHADSV